MDRPDITQAMINAYDEYTHLTLDRRRFMEKLTALAGSGAESPDPAASFQPQPLAAWGAPAWACIWRFMARATSRSHCTSDSRWA